jgi:hypothetical protein
MSLLCFDQHIAEDGHCGSRTDNIENLLEAVAKMILVDLELHGLNFWDFGVTGNAYILVSFLIYKSLLLNRCVDEL